MAKLNGFIETLTDTIVSAGSSDILGGYPIGFNGQVAAADARIAGIAKHDVLTATTSPNGRTQIGSALTIIVIGKVPLVAGGTITAGDYLKVGATAGQVLSADAAAFAAGKVIGKAITGTTTVGATIQAYVGAI